MILAVITAREGSKRIPKKNIREFLGKPIIEYSIEAARNAKLFDEIMVSTDSEEIAAIATNAGASVPFLRTARTSGDYSSTSEVIVEVLDEYKKRGSIFDRTCCIYPTAPFITSSLLNEANEMMNSDIEADAVIPVVKYSYPPQRGLIINDDVLYMKYPRYKSVRSQDLTPIYHDAGQFYLLKTETFVKSQNIWSGKIRPIILSEKNVQDIDNLEDWVLAELKYKLIKNGDN